MSLLFIRFLGGMEGYSFVLRQCQVVGCVAGKMAVRVSASASRPQCIPCEVLRLHGSVKLRIQMEGANVLSCYVRECRNGCDWLILKTGCGAIAVQ